MKVQKAIDNLSCMKMEIRNMEDIKQLKRVRITTIETAVAALKKQIPMKVSDEYCCPACGCCGVDGAGITGDYCTNCGQKLDWTDLLN